MRAEARVELDPAFVLHEFFQARAEIAPARHQLFPEGRHSLCARVRRTRNQNLIEDRPVTLGRPAHAREQLDLSRRQSAPFQSLQRAIELLLRVVQAIEELRFGDQQVASADRDHLLGGQLGLKCLREVVGIHFQDLLAVRRFVPREQGGADRGHRRNQRDQAEADACPLCKSRPRERWDELGHGSLTSMLVSRRCQRPACRRCRNVGVRPAARSRQPSADPQPYEHPTQGAHHEGPLKRPPHRVLDFLHEAHGGPPDFTKQRWCKRHSRVGRRRAAKAGGRALAQARSA